MSEDLIPTHPYFDLSNPQHFVNLLPDKVKQSVLEIPLELFQFPEKELIVKVYQNKFPTDLDMALRFAFWEEYHLKFEKLQQMTIAKICKGSCLPQQFYELILPNPGRLLFICTEPTVTKNRMKYAFHLTLQEMLDVIKMPTEVNIKTGTTDTKLLDIKYKIFEYLDQRLHGSLIQRVEQTSKNLNVNVNTTAEELSNPKTPDEIDQRIRDLELELSPTQLQLELPKPKDSIASLMDKIQQEAGRVTPEFNVNKRTINQEEKT